MKKIHTKWFLLIGWILTLSVIAGLLYSQMQWLTTSPLNRDLPLRPSMGVTDEQGFLYILDYEQESIVRLDPDQQFIIDQTIGLDKHDIPLITDIEVGSDGDVYVLMNESNDEYLQAERQVIKRYESNGTEEIIYGNEMYSDSENLGSSNIVNLHKIDEDKLSFIYVKDDEFQQMIINKKGEVKPSGDVVTVFTNSYISNVAGSHENGWIYITNKSEIYKIENEVSERIFPNNQSFSNKSTIDHFDYDVKKHTFWFLDNYDQAWKEIDLSSDSQTKTVLSESELVSQGFQGSIIDVVRNHSTESETKFLLTNDRIAELNNDYLIERYLTNFPRSSIEIFYHYSIWVLAVGFVLLLGYVLKRLYYEFINKKISLVVKQVAVVTPILILGMFLLLFFFNNDSRERIELESERELRIHVTNGQIIIETESIQPLEGTLDYMNDDYQLLKKSAERAFEAVEDDQQSGYSFTIYKWIDQNLHMLMTNDIYNQRPFFGKEDAFIFSDTIQDGTVAETHLEDIYGILRVAGPLYNDAGNLVGVYEVGKDLSTHDQNALELLLNNYKPILSIIAGMITIFILVTYFLLRPFRTLRNGVQAFADGDWSARISIHSKDEIQDLSERFNEMTNTISTSVKEISTLKDSYYRFVPQQFLHFLGKESIHELKLGDQAEKEMIIFVVSLNSFYEKSVLMTPEENFNYMNHFLQKTGPVIRKYGGLVSNYRGSSVLALFPNTTLEAISAAEVMANDMRNESEKFTKDKQKFDIRIGIHKGPLMLGIVGEEERLAGTCISESVNQTEEVEKISSKLGCNVLLTGTAFTDLGNNKLEGCRYLGEVLLEENKEVITLYDYYASEYDDIAHLKKKTKARFEKGVTLYQAGRFLDARMEFVSVIRENPFDLAAKRYFFLCDEYYKKGTPIGWAGSLLTSFDVDKDSTTFIKS